MAAARAEEGTSMSASSRRLKVDSPPRWVTDAVFYQMFPDRFARSARVPKLGNLEPWEAPPSRHGYKGGDLLGIVEHLDWLTDLGVNAIYLNPIFQSASNHRYHTHDYYRVDPLLGGNEAFDELLAAAHERGMKVILDGVFNHASRGFYQFNDILENGAASPWRDWFTVYEFPPNAYDESRDPDYAAWWGLHALPEFNTENPEVREFIMGVAERWIERGADGWRLDVPGEIRTAGFWEEFRSRVKAKNNDAYLVGEFWGTGPDWTGEGGRFDGLMNYPLMSAILRFVAVGRIDFGLANTTCLNFQPFDAHGYEAEVRRVLEAYSEATTRANLNLLGSHDLPRLLSLVGGHRSAVKLAAVLLFTSPGAPCIYYGDEIGMTGGSDPECRGAFPWEHQNRWDWDLLDTFRSLVGLRHREPAFRLGHYRHFYADGGFYAFAREHEGDRLMVAVNAGNDPAGHTTQSPGRRVDALWGEGEAKLVNGCVRVDLPARSAGVWRI